jgi:hypothetical protein
VDPDLSIRRPDQEPVGRDGGTVVATSDEDDLVAVLREPAPDDPSDGPGAEDDEPHGLSLPREDLLCGAGTR